MKQAIVFLFTILIFVSCKEKVNSVQDVMNALAPDEQKSTIDPTVDNLIKGEKGTKIFIPANALRFKDGTTPTGKVNIELKEFFSISDFISNNLSTRSDSFLLETGGMLYISVTADRKELVIDNSKSYTIAFPKRDSTEGMELFYRDTNSASINWQPAFPVREGLSDPALADSTLYENKIELCGWIWMSEKEWGWKLNHPDSNVWNYVNKNLLLPDKLIKQLCEMDPYFEIGFQINKQGKIFKVRFKKGISQTLEETITNFLKSIPPFDMRTVEYHDYEGFEYEFTLCCHKKFNQEKYKERFKQKYSQYQDKAIEKMDKGDLGIYIFQATKFGWINCDRFLNDSTEKIDYIVRTPQTNESKVMIVFDDIKSIMCGEIKNNEATFKNVPISSKIKVIGISYKNGKPLLSKMPAVVRKEPFELSGFKEFTLKELEKELNN